MGRRDEPPELNCALCGRLIPRHLITRHHLLPREEGGGPEHTADLCKACHGHLHALYDNRTLARQFATLDALRRDPQVLKFVKFIRKQSPTATFRSSTTRKKRR